MKQNKPLMFTIIAALVIIVSGCSKSSNSDFFTINNDQSDVSEDYIVSDDNHEESQSNMEAEEYYKQNADVVSVIETENAENVTTETETKSFFADRGFDGYPIQTEYDADGQEYDEKLEIGESPDQKHPLYEMHYISEKEILWTIYISNGSIFAYPVSYNLVSERKAPLLVTESDTVIGYDSENNKYFETIPKKESVILMKINKIDKAALDNLDMEGLASYEE